MRKKMERKTYKERKKIKEIKNNFKVNKLFLFAYSI